ncbi:redoxin domain-containing protein [Novosphingobium piscinae]|uniref:Redoxin domain-containing protein n=1 Tax=Novosphingobium piscinae TaxID=1507448 RepID=A0A7X1KQH8_9SPHN|nr:redoxin domain-containing protein [Novosphingobium piscinae]MBC2669777.1 redoxin domain-containing protein [Novosphingobium piscinae]
MFQSDSDPATTYGRLADDLVGRLRHLGLGQAVPRIGQAMPDFALPDERGRLRRLDEFTGSGPVVISFLRGRWCPYCEAELVAWNRTLAAATPGTFTLLCIVAQTGGAAADISGCFSAPVTVLCDVDHGLALELGLAFHVGEPLLRQMASDGLDLAALYGTAAGLLPIPATFALDRQGIVRAAFVEPDFRLRAEPADMLRALGLSG